MTAHEFAILMTILAAATEIGFVACYMHYKFTCDLLDANARAMNVMLGQDKLPLMNFGWKPLWIAVGIMTPLLIATFAWVFVTLPT